MPRVPRLLVRLAFGGKMGCGINVSLSAEYGDVAAFSQSNVLTGRAFRLRSMLTALRSSNAVTMMPKLREKRVSLGRATLLEI